MLRSLVGASILSVGLLGTANAACFGAPGIETCVDMGRQYVLNPSPSDPTTIPLDSTLGLSMVLQAQTPSHHWAAEMYVISRNQHMIAFGQYSWMCSSLDCAAASQCRVGYGDAKCPASSGVDKGANAGRK